jgi:hypothetical protein
LGEISDLRTLGGTTVDGSVPNSGRLSELGTFLLDLDSKLSGGGKDEDNGSISSFEKRLGVDVDHGREGERDGLSGTSLGDSDEISSRKGHGPSLTLDRGRSGETHSSDLRHDILGETGFVKGSDGSGDILTGDLVVSLVLNDQKGSLPAFPSQLGKHRSRPGNVRRLGGPRHRSYHQYISSVRNKWTNFFSNLIKDWEFQSMLLRPAPRLDIRSPPPPVC